ncbi:MAG: HDIG domain-containing protein [Chloroflexota bacterium]|nr:HDIG domain-containing protein [Chloroflexota bacterium]NOG64764.1 HDIG domain-containing protein [Chloroflexota bacterium]GIK63238.1 MAG: HDIG domain-containing protein [Chloroflexota bacterium]
MIGRVRQTLQATFAWVLPLDERCAKLYLSEAQFALFKTMRRSERQHHLRVLEKLLKKGQNHPALITAALLHDVGKTRARFTIIERILAVLVKKFLPHQFETWANGEAKGWKQPFVVSAKHPEWGAEMVAMAGDDAMVVELIRQHQNRLKHPPANEFEDLLVALQASDDVS